MLFQQSSLQPSPVLYDLLYFVFFFLVEYFIFKLFCSVTYFKL